MIKLQSCYLSISCCFILCIFKFKKEPFEREYVLEQILPNFLELFNNNANKRDMGELLDINFPLRVFS